MGGRNTSRMMPVFRLQVCEGSRSVSKLHFFPSLRSCEHGCRLHACAMVLCPSCPRPLPPHRRPPSCLQDALPSSALQRNIHSRPQHRALGTGSPPLGRGREARPYKKACLDRNQPAPRQAESPQGLGTWKAPCVLGEGVGGGGRSGWAGVEKAERPSQQSTRSPQRTLHCRAEPRPLAEALGDPAWGRYLGGKLNRITISSMKKFLIAHDSKNQQKTECPQAGAWQCHLQHNDPVD